MYLVTLEKKQFALKFFHEKTETYLRNYRNECLYLQKLDHSSIITCIEHGFFDGYPYIILPYFEQGDVRKHAEITKKWTSSERIEDALFLFKKMVEILIYLHQQNLVHRDIKPANIVLSSSNTPILIDFGTITEIGTEEDFFIGTPSYASPEQIQGSRVDHRSDIFSLAASMYFVLSKQKPFGDRERNIPGFLHHIDATIPIALSNIIQRSLHIDPSKRPSLQEIYTICSELEIRSKFHVLAGRTSVQAEIGFVLQQIHEAKNISLRIVGDSLVDVQWAVQILTAEATKENIPIFEIVEDDDNKNIPIDVLTTGIIIDHTGNYPCQQEIFFPPLRVAEIRRSLYAHLQNTSGDLAVISCNVEEYTGGNPDMLVHFIKNPHQTPSTSPSLLTELHGFEIDIVSLLAQTRDSICLENFLHVQSPEIKKAFIDLQKHGLIRHSFAGRWRLYRESLRQDICTTFHLSVPSITETMISDVKNEIEIASLDFEQGHLYAGLQKMYHLLDKAYCLHSRELCGLIYKKLGIFHLRIGDFFAAEQHLADAAVFASALQQESENFQIDIYRAIVHLEKNNSKSGSILAVERLIRCKGNKKSPYYYAICAWAMIILKDYRNHQRFIQKYKLTQSAEQARTPTDLFFLQYVIRALKIQNKEADINTLLQQNNIEESHELLRWEYSKILPNHFEKVPIGNLSLKLTPLQLLHLKNRWKE